MMPPHEFTSAPSRQIFDDSISFTLTLPSSPHRYRSKILYSWVCLASNLKIVSAYCKKWFFLLTSISQIVYAASSDVNGLTDETLKMLLVKVEMLRRNEIKMTSNANFFLRFMLTNNTMRCSINVHTTLDKQEEVWTWSESFFVRFVRRPWEIVQKVGN
jgi:hypothetical protein